MLDANDTFLNTGAPTHQDHSAGGFSTPNVTIVQESHLELCDSLSSDHSTITITLNLPSEKLMGQKRLVWHWTKGNLPAFTNEVEDQIPQEYEGRKMEVDEMHARMSVNPIEGSPKTRWADSGGNG